MGKREDNKAEKQRRLEAAGLAAFLDDGFAVASIETIAEAAGVARGTFYLYFEDKAALFRVLIDRFFVPLLALVRRAKEDLAATPDGPSQEPVYRELALNVALVLLPHTSEVKVYFRETRAAGAGGDAVRERAAAMEALIEEILVDAVARGILRPHDVHVAALAIYGAIERLTWAFLQGDPKLDLATQGDEVVRLLREGLYAR